MEPTTTACMKCLYSTGGLWFRSLFSTLSLHLDYAPGDHIFVKLHMQKNNSPKRQSKNTWKTARSTRSTSYLRLASQHLFFFRMDQEHRLHLHKGLCYNNKTSTMQHHILNRPWWNTISLYSTLKLRNLKGIWWCNSKCTISRWWKCKGSWQCSRIRWQSWHRSNNNNKCLCQLKVSQL